MNFYKSIISLLLLLTYSFGFAHNLVPHCNDSFEENHTHAPTHKHHQNIDGEESNDEHNHIFHNNHYDESVSDFFTCLVQETETPENECSVEHCFTFSANDNNLNLSKQQATIILFAVLQPIVQSESIANYFKELEINYLSPPLGDSPHRGPPSFSC